GIPVYCTPDLYEGSPASLFRNAGDGTFEDVSLASGIGSVRGKGLAACIVDLDEDAWPDIYCANDLQWNFLFRNLGAWRFEEIGFLSGAGLSEDGREEAGMGVDAADVDGDGTLDLIVSNFQTETNALYRNEGGMTFTEVSRLSGMAETDLRRLAFGIRFFDFDSDGIQDVVVANGHIYDNAAEVDPTATYAQPPSLFRGRGGGRFLDVTDSAGKDFAAPRVGRGLALGDLDADGDLDLVLAINNGPPSLLENRAGGGNAWLALRLIGVRCDRSALGARVTLECGGTRQEQVVRCGGSYLSQSDPRVFFGLARAERVDQISVRWPDGKEEAIRNVPARRLLTLVEG
ncbi:MAG: CRTAC1 family protein, partial [Planctomycetota bacterium]